VRERGGLDDETLGFVLQALKTVTERRLDKETRLSLDDDAMATATGDFELMDRVAVSLETVDLE
jgi:hypothetical protein